MKKIFSLILVAVTLLTALSLSSCSSGKPVIAIQQFGSHGSLNNCYTGIIEGLKESGIDLEKYEIRLVNDNFDPTVAQTHARNFVNSDVEIIIAIATPSAVNAANAADGTSIPVVFCAITDGSVMENYQNVTGASDVPNFAKQLEVVTAVMGKSDLKIGVLYSTDESSSPFQVAQLKLAAESYTGMEIADRAISDITTIDTHINALIADNVDCFVNLLDNTVVGKLESNILPLTNAARIPVFGSEIEQVKVGCAASASIEYVGVGKLAGNYAALILKGEKTASELSVATISDPINCYNSNVCADLGLIVPDTLNATDVVAK